MGSFSKGLYLGVCVLDSQGISFCSSKGMPFNCSAIRFMRANGDGVAEMRVRGSAAMVASCGLPDVTGKGSEVKSLRNGQEAESWDAIFRNANECLVQCEYEH